MEKVIPKGSDEEYTQKSGTLFADPPSPLITASRSFSTLKGGEASVYVRLRGEQLEKHGNADLHLMGEVPSEARRRERRIALAVQTGSPLSFVCTFLVKGVSAQPKASLAQREVDRRSRDGGIVCELRCAHETDINIICSCLSFGGTMIVPVDASNLADAAAVHAAAWRASHCAFCTPEFVALHTAERQAAYLQTKLDAGSRFFLLVDDQPVGVVSVTGDLIEDLYVLPEQQGRGYGTKLLRFAAAICPGTPMLWILENNAGARRLYARLGFFETGNRKVTPGGLDEIELVQKPERMETKRLILDRIKETDREDYFNSISHDKKVLKTFVCRYAESLGTFDFSTYLGRDDLFAIRLKETGRLIGIILYFDEQDGACEIGYGIGSDHWNKGYVTEAVKRFLSYLFEEKGMKTVYASYFTGNDASRRVMEKCGMRYSRFSEREFEYLGEWRDLTYYAVTRS